MKRELDVLNITNPRNIWREIIYKIDFDLDAILPVQMVEPEENVFLGSFRASLVEEGGKKYMQLEDFSSVEWAEIFFKIYPGGWEDKIGGIYRMELGINSNS